MTLAFVPRAPRSLGSAPAGERARAEDRAWSRAVLPAVSRTFALNIRLLGGSMGEAVRTAYLLCRVADTIEDAWPGERREIERRFDQLVAAVALDAGAAEALARDADRLGERANPAHRALVANLPLVVRCFAALPAEDRADITAAVRTLASGMRHYAARAADRRAERAAADAPDALFPYLDDEAELHDYCWIVAGCVGVMLTRLFARRCPGAGGASQAERRLALAPIVGEGLQLTNILLDWPSDARSGRCHIPASWLAQADLTAADLCGGLKSDVFGLALRLESLARRALGRVPDYLDTVPARCVRYRQFCLWPALWALASLDRAARLPGFPTGSARPRIPRSKLIEVAAAALALGHGAAGVRGLYRRFGTGR